MDDWLNYHHLRCFVAVVEEGGLAPAARRLSVTHPTISEQLRKLEANLGLELFDRRGRRLRLTDSGHMVYRHAAQIFGVGASLLAAVEARRTGRAVLGRIGVDSVLPKLSVRRILSIIFDGLGPSLRLRCTEDQREPLVAALESRQLDLVLSDAPARAFGSAAVESVRIRSGHLALYASPALAAQLEGPFPERLHRAPFLLSMPGSRRRRDLERWLGEQRIEPRIVAEVEDSGLIKALGQDGRGIFAMPAVLADDICGAYGVEVVGEIASLEERMFAIHPRASSHPVVRVLNEASDDG